MYRMPFSFSKLYHTLVFICNLRYSFSKCNPKLMSKIVKLSLKVRWTKCENCPN